MTTIPLGPGGEFDLVRALLARWGDRAVGVGDDAATLRMPHGEQLVVSTDASIEGVHFRDYLSAEEIGHRATAAALSDLAAMAATPLGLVVALGIPERWRPLATRLADGIGAAAAHAHAPIIGGDTTRADRLTITVTVLGSAWRPLRREGARPGDVVYVTGRLGAPARALAALERGEEPRPADRRRFVNPTPRLEEARWLARAGATAALDLSDGLVADLAHLAAASRVEVRLDLERVPCWEDIAPDLAAQSGEEYELIVAAPPTLDAAAFEARFGIPLTAVAEVCALAERDTGVVTLADAGERVARLRGHDHFST